MPMGRGKNNETLLYPSKKKGQPSKTEKFKTITTVVQSSTPEKNVAPLLPMPSKVQQEARTFILASGNELPLPPQCQWRPLGECGLPSLSPNLAVVKCCLTTGIRSKKICH